MGNLTDELDKLNEKIDPAYIVQEKTLAGLFQSGFEEAFLKFSSLVDIKDVHLLSNTDLLNVASKVKYFTDYLDKLDVLISEINPSDTKKLAFFSAIREKASIALLDKWEELRTAAVKNNFTVADTLAETLKKIAPNSTKLIAAVGKQLTAPTLMLGMLYYQANNIQNDPKNSSLEVQVKITELALGTAVVEWGISWKTVQKFIATGLTKGASTGFAWVTSRLIIANIGLSLWYSSWRVGTEWVLDSFGFYEYEWFVKNSDAIIQYFENSNTEEEREPIIHLAHILKLLDPSLDDETLKSIMGIRADDTDPRFMNYELAKSTLMRLIATITGQEPRELSSPENFMAEIGHYFRELYEYRDKLTFDYTAELLNDYAVTKAMGSGADALAYRYALVKGYHFAVLGLDYSEYANELSLYDPNTGTGLLTEQFLKDRANAISIDVWAKRIGDSDGIVSAPFGVPIRVRDLIYTELETGKKVGLDGLDLGVLDPDQVIFGTKNDDKKELTGSVADDHVYGGAGDDTLNGKGGNNYLEGGTGFDTYEVGEGVDTILDIDGQGEIIFNGKKLTEANYVGGAESGGDVWEDADGNVYMRKGNDLVILNKKGSSGSGSTGGAGSGTNDGGSTSGEGGTPPDNTGSGTNGGGPSTGSSYHDLLTVKDFFNMVKPYGEAISALDLMLYGEAKPNKPNTNLGNVPSSPLVLSPNKNAVLTTSILNGVYFDLDNNGHKEWTAWTLQGILCFDIDEDGIISHGGELFGNHTILKNGQKAANGFEALKEKDSNHDAKIDENDELYHKLLIWFDRNQDGISQPDEIMTLIEAAIKSIDLNYINSNDVDSNGNSHKQQGSYTLTDGSIANISDVWFQSDFFNTKDDLKLTWSDEVAKLTNLSGLGNTYDLRNAMMLDQTGRLTTLAVQLTNAISKNTSFEDITDLINALIFEWAGVASYAENSRGANIDGRVMHALEVFYGQKFTEHNGAHADPTAKAASGLKEVYYGVFKYVLDSFIFDLKVTPLLDSIIFNLNDETHQIDLDISRLLATFEKEFSYNPKDFIYILDIVKTTLAGKGELEQKIINQIAKAGNLTGSVFERLLAASFTFNVTSWELGQNGEDFWFIAKGDGNYVLGGSTNQTITGTSNPDTFYSDSGNSHFLGGNGSDTYIFAKGHGQDVIYDYGYSSATETDTLIFTDVRSSEVKFGRSGDNLVLFGYNGTDRITIEKFFTSTQYSYAIEVFKFLDKTITYR